MDSLIAERVVIITGGSAGIGRAAVELFARNGARVVLGARGTHRGQEVAARLQAEGRHVLFVQADVSRPEDVQRLIRTTVESFGRIDCAFNNAAALANLKRSAEYSEVEFDSEVALNVKSVWLCMKHEIEQMKKQVPPGGAIVNTSSVNGLGGASGGSLYSMAKAGVLALTKSAAQEYAKDGIRVNALVAGGFDTDMLRSAVGQMAGNDPVKVAQGLEEFAARVPLGRVGDPLEAAQAALWLCSSAASYVTGMSMIVDGGLTSWAR
jgi:NAD(P)-dependent dehydrogenase (short-subunit alcohol dehydrogenase family)